MKIKTPTKILALLHSSASSLNSLLLALLISLVSAFASQRLQAEPHYQVLLSFSDVTNHNTIDGAGLCLGSDGVLYGTTDWGITVGTIYRVDRDGTGYRVLHDFTGINGDGAVPHRGVVEGRDGALYGTTRDGGDFGLGTIYKLNRDGSGYRVLHSFAGAPDGEQPGFTPYAQNELLAASNGAIYGTTDLGGTYSDGTLFTINPDGSGYQVLYSFGQLADGFHDYGEYPAGGLIEGSDGALYGTAEAGGLGDVKGGDGVVFRVGKDGSAYTILHNFSYDNGDAYAPEATLLEASDGALYGVTAEFANNDTNAGAAFKLSKDGSGYQVLHVFDGSDATSHRLVEGWDGALYGTTERGGVNQGGMIYSLKKDGSAYTIVHTFPSSDCDGYYPEAGLVKSFDGAFYGSIPRGGCGGTIVDDGVVFKMWPPQTPDMLSVTRAGNVAQVSMVGAAGYHYQLLRSTNLTVWSAIATITMPPAGAYTYLDTSSPAIRAFYRAAWMR